MGFPSFLQQRPNRSNNLHIPRKHLGNHPIDRLPDLVLIGIRISFPTIAFAVRIIAGVQKPHCTPNVPRRPSGAGESLLVAASRSPSIVRISLSSHSIARVRQDRVGFPLIKTVHAPAVSSLTSNLRTRQTQPLSQHISQ